MVVSHALVDGSRPMHVLITLTKLFGLSKIKDMKLVAGMLGRYKKGSEVEMGLDIIIFHCIQL